MGCNLVDIDVAVGRLAVAVHPDGQQQSHGQHGDWQQGVHQYVEQRECSRRGLDH